MPGLFSIDFDSSAWRIAKQSSRSVNWTTRTGEKIAFEFYDVATALPVSLAEIDAVRKFYRQLVARERGGLISVDVLKLGEVNVVKLVTKHELKAGTRLVRNVGTLVFLFHECSYAVSVEAEQSVASPRESTAFTELRRTRGPTVAIPQSEWVRDPYDPDEQMPFPRNLSDDEEWDARFPTHSLSRVRGLLSHIERTVHFETDLSTLTPFLHPKA